MDYENIIDAETWAFIRKTEDYYPPDAIDLTIAEQRSIYDRMCRAFFEGYPEGISAHDAM
ncbi:esterase, partial [Pseudomonas fluorescens]